MHAANLGAQIINISNVICMSARNVLDQADLGAALRYAAVDRNAVIVAAAGDTSSRDCKQNPVFDPLNPDDPRDWGGVTTVVTPAWFSDYVMTVGSVDATGAPMDKMSVAGPWVSIAAPGTDVVGLSTRDDSLVNAVDGPDNTLLTPTGTSFATAIVSGVAALVRAKYPELTSHQIVNRLIHTARPPARGVDNQLGYGVVDPVAALTWDVPEGPGLPTKSAPLNIPPPTPPRNMTPVWVAAGGLAAVLLILQRGGRKRETAQTIVEGAMKEQSRFGITLSWARITAVFLIDVAVLALASHWPQAWNTHHIAFWVGVVLALAVTIVGLVTYRRNTLASALAARVLDRFADPQATLTAGRTPAVNHQRRYGRDVVGIREHQGRSGLGDRGGGPRGTHRPSPFPGTCAGRTTAARGGQPAAPVRRAPRRDRYCLSGNAIRRGGRPPDLVAAADGSTAQRRRRGGPRLGSGHAGSRHRTACARSGRRTTHGAAGDG